MLLNQEIRANKVMLLSAEGEKLGFFTSRDAFYKAQNEDLDLVQVAENEKDGYVICKIMDYNKFLYHQQKEKHKSELKNKVHENKEMRFKLNIGEHDFDVKMKKCLGFIEEGSKVKILLEIKGRENSNKQGIENFVEKVKARFVDVAELDAEPKFEGKGLSLFWKPSKKLVKKPKV